MVIWEILQRSLYRSGNQNERTLCPSRQGGLQADRKRFYQSVRRQILSRRVRARLMFRLEHAAAAHQFLDWPFAFGAFGEERLGSHRDFPPISSSCAGGINLNLAW